MFFIMSRALGLKTDPADLSRNATVTVAPRTVTARRGTVGEPSKFPGDAQVQVTPERGASTIDLGLKDLNTGSATVFATASTRAGNYTVVVTGHEFGKKVTRPVTVRRW